MLVPPRKDPWEQLIASGRVLASTRAGSVLDEAPCDFGVDASARLAAMRKEER